MSVDADVCKRKHGGDRESLDAHAAVAGHAQNDRERILKFIAERGDEGATCDEIAAAWETEQNQISGRFKELRDRFELIAWSGELRLTRRNNNAKVYVLKRKEPPPPGCLF